MAERYWKVLLAVFYCNSKDKTLVINDWCAHEGEPNHDQRKVADWSFTKNEYERYKNVQDPGTIKEFVLGDLCTLNYSDLFYNAPFWNQVSIDHITIALIDFDTSHFPNVPFKCVRLEVNFEEYSDLPLPTGTWTTFTNCEKLEIYFSWNNEEAHKIKYHNVLKLFKHLSLHVIL